MTVNNILKPHSGFEILQTTLLSQSAVMDLAPGESSSKEPNSHPLSDQTVVVLQGMVSAEIDGKKLILHKGDSVTVPAGARHRFVNISGELVTTFNVYSPPAYSGSGVA
ncbi:MAG TPA: cupin domain-containing protein [Chthoniobacteraceae bacterium]|nr:cupin domain-containing protein [Chthoniobacteraceae bacterium]